MPIKVFDIKAYYIRIKIYGRSGTEMEVGEKETI